MSIDTLIECQHFQYSATLTISLKEILGLGKRKLEKLLKQEIEKSAVAFFATETTPNPIIEIHSDFTYNPLEVDKNQNIVLQAIANVSLDPVNEILYLL
jgi:hypothetical protein